MRAENAGKRRFELRQSDKVILGVIGVLVLIIIVLNIMQRCGLSLINGALTLYLPVLSLAVLIGWIGYVLIRRINNRTAKLIVGSVLGMLLFLALMLVFTYVSFFANYNVPQKYATIKSPSGEHTLAVLRVVDITEEHVEQRKAARLAADPDGDPEITAADLGFIYRAYPETLLGLFYRSDADVEGEVYLTYREGVAASEQGEEEKEEEAEPEPIGVMMLEWLDDGNTAHFFVENAGVAEGGECYVRF